MEAAVDGFDGVEGDCQINCEAFDDDEGCYCSEPAGGCLCDGEAGGARADLEDADA